MNTKTSAIAFAIVMVFSSFVGCIDTEEEKTDSVTSPTIIPPIDPIKTAAHTPDETPKYLTRKNDATINTTAEPIVPNLRAISGLLSENNRTIMIPIIEQIRPSEAKAKGINCNIY